MLAALHYCNVLQYTVYTTLHYSTSVCRSHSRGPRSAPNTRHCELPDTACGRGGARTALTNGHSTVLLTIRTSTHCIVLYNTSLYCLTLHTVLYSNELYNTAAHCSLPTAHTPATVRSLSRSLSLSLSLPLSLSTCLPVTVLVT